MNIQVTSAPQQNLMGGPENMVTELKTSIFMVLFGEDKARVVLRGRTFPLSKCTMKG